MGFVLPSPSRGLQSDTQDGDSEVAADFTAENRIGFSSLGPTNYPTQPDAISLLQKRLAAIAELADPASRLIADVPLDNGFLLEFVACHAEGSEITGRQPRCTVG